jgi:hypothetical protein
MEKFEYKVVTYDPHGFFGGNVKEYQIANRLNQLGNDGWELVGCTSSNQSYGATKSIVCIFKSLLIKSQGEIEENIRGDFGHHK